MGIVPKLVWQLKFFIGRPVPASDVLTFIGLQIKDGRIFPVSDTASANRSRETFIRPIHILIWKAKRVRL